LSFPTEGRNLPKPATVLAQSTLLKGLVYVLGDFSQPEADKLD